MGELGLNKIFGALLAVALVIMGLREVSAIISGGGHHAHHEYESVNKWAESNFKGYRIEIPETGGGGDIVEVIYDLGALLVGADLARGERSFKAKCASCHTLDQGGSNGTGPNLYGVLGNAKQAVAGFGYSGALSNTDGSWSWENMDNWLQNPSGYARGTNMAFAGLKRDDERAAVLAYLATYSPNAPAQPEPLPEESAEAVDLSEATETAEAEADVYSETVNAAIEAGADTADAAEDAVAEASDVATEAAPALSAIVDAGVSTEAVAEVADTAAEAEAAVETASDAVASAPETVETAVTDAVTENADAAVADATDTVTDVVDEAVSAVEESTDASDDE